MRPKAERRAPSELLAWARAAARRLHDVARASPRGGDARWLRCLADLGVAPLPDEARARHLSEGASFHSGPPPLEMRRALEALVAHVRARAGEAAGGTPARLGEAADDLTRELDVFVSDGMKRYLQAVRGAVSTASIFANALATTAPSIASGEGPAVEALRCGSCGAARRGGDGSRSICEFCGSPLLGR